MPTPSTPPPNWQPISSLPLIATALDGMLESAREQYSNLQQAKSRPYTLDERTVGRIISAYTQQANDLWLYEEQLRRWKGEGSAQEQQEVSRLEGQLEALRTQIRSLLALAEDLKTETIESLINKSDLEVALDFLSGKLQLP